MVPGDLSQHPFFGSSPPISIQGSQGDVTKHTKLGIYTRSEFQGEDVKGPPVKDPCPCDPRGVLGNLGLEW